MNGKATWLAIAVSAVCAYEGLALKEYPDIAGSLNRISRTLLSHSEREEKVTAKLDEMGGMEAMSERAAYVDTLIERQKKRNDALGKIAQSTVVWALIVMLGFLSMAVWETVVHAIKAKAGN